MSKPILPTININLFAGILGIFCRGDLPALFYHALRHRALVERLRFTHLSQHLHALDYPSITDAYNRIDSVERVVGQSVNRVLLLRHVPSRTAPCVKLAQSY